MCDLCFPIQVNINRSLYDGNAIKFGLLDYYMLLAATFLFAGINPNAAGGIYYPEGCPALLIAAREGRFRALKEFVDQKQVTKAHECVSLYFKTINL